MLLLRSEDGNDIYNQQEKQRFLKKEQQSTGRDSNRSGTQGATFAASSGKLNHQSTGGDDRCRKALALVMAPAH